MNAIDLLADQHLEVMDLFEQIEQSTDNDEKLALFEELADDLAAHTTIEEQLFYPVAYTKAPKEKLNEALEEHMQMKRLVAELLTMTPEDDDDFDAKIMDLKNSIVHHVKEEEGELFKQVRAEIDSDELERLGVKMHDRFEEELNEEPSEKVLEEIESGAEMQSGEESEEATPIR